MTHSITRRRLAGLVAAPALMAQAPAPLPRNADEELAAVREQNRKNSEALANAKVDMSAEPAFVFKA